MITNRRFKAETVEIDDKQRITTDIWMIRVTIAYEWRKLPKLAIFFVFTDYGNCYNPSFWYIVLKFLLYWFYFTACYHSHDIW